MKVGGVPHRSIELDADGWAVRVIDQTLLPARFEKRRLETVDEAADAIRTMVVRGAPLIGATAAYGMALAARFDPREGPLSAAAGRLVATRPTAVNLRWAVARALDALLPVPEVRRAAAAYELAARVCDEDVATNRAIGEHGLAILHELASTRARHEPLRVLTHCNAGWLATVDWGTATAPLYSAHDQGLPLHVWVDETRPRLQGARLTAWELGGHGVPHAVVPDAAAAHLMSTGRVDAVLVGTDRTTRSGDVANKIGTYALALAAADNDVPFYVAVPSTSIDWTLDDGRLIPIEERDAAEVSEVEGRAGDGSPGRVRILPEGSPAVNYAFDVTPARLITGLVTERGACAASREGLAELFPEGAGLTTPSAP